MKHGKSRWVVGAACLVTAVLGGLGCGAGSGEATEDPVGTTAEAFSNGWYFRTWYGDLDYDTGLSPSVWTCFLAGGGGFMFDGTPAGRSNAYSGAAIDSGTWHQVARNGYTGYDPPIGSLIGSSIMCVPTPAVVPPVQWKNWNGDTPPLRLASTADPDLVCGLVAFSNSSGDNGTWGTTADSGFTSGDTAYVFKNSGYWWLGGSGRSEAWAACVDHTPNTSVYTHQFFNSNGTGTSSQFRQADIDYTQCFLSGIGGNFGDEQGPRQAGAWLGYTFSDFEWSETTYDWQEMQVTCIQ